jgi:hypothetical protein
LASFCFGALGEPSFKFGITGRREAGGSGCLAATEVFSGRRTLLCAGVVSIRMSVVVGLVATAGAEATAATGRG